jgi:hypothetical protein
MITVTFGIPRREVPVIKDARPMRLVSDLFRHPHGPYRHDHESG